MKRTESLDRKTRSRINRLPDAGFLLLTTALLSQPAFATSAVKPIATQAAHATTAPAPAASAPATSTAPTAASTSGELIKEPKAAQEAGMAEFDRFVRNELSKAKDVAEARKIGIEFFTRFFKNLSESVSKEYGISPDEAPFQAVARGFEEETRKAGSTKDIISQATVRFEWVIREHRRNLEINRYKYLGKVSRYDERIKALEDRVSGGEATGSSDMKTSAAPSRRVDFASVMDTLLNPQGPTGMALSSMAALSAVNFLILLMMTMSRKK